MDIVSFTYSGQCVAYSCAVLLVACMFSHRGVLMTSRRSLLGNNVEKGDIVVYTRKSGGIRFGIVLRITAKGNATIARYEIVNAKWFVSEDSGVDCSDIVTVDLGTLKYEGMAEYYGIPPEDVWDMIMRIRNRALSLKARRQLYGRDYP